MRRAEEVRGQREGARTHLLQGGAVCNVAHREEGPPTCLALRPLCTPQPVTAKHRHASEKERKKERKKERGAGAW
eukprot:1666810-Rhodomonas_salina.1